MAAEDLAERTAPLRTHWSDKSPDKRIQRLSERFPSMLRAIGRRRIDNRAELIALGEALLVNAVYQGQYGRRLLVNRSTSNRNQLPALLDAGQAAGWWLQHIGSWSPYGGFVTELEILPALFDEALPPAAHEIAPDLKTVLEMRDDHGEPVKFPGRDFRSLAPQVKRLNMILRKTRVRLKDEALVSPQVRRVFNGDINHGGRFYHTLQNRPKEERKALLMDDEPVAELDFNALHVRLLYAEQGIEYPLDQCPYTAACKNPDDDDERKVVKVAALQVINDTSAKAAIAHLKGRQNPQRIEAHYRYLLERRRAHRSGSKPPERPQCLPKGGFTPLDETADYEGAVCRFMAAHEPIAHRFHEPGQALKLQRSDARISERVIARCVERGWPVLPIHDSFVVQDRHGEALKTFMDDAYEAETGGFRCPIK